MRKVILIAAGILFIGVLISAYYLTLPFTPTISEAVFRDRRTYGDLVMRQTLRNRFSPSRRSYEITAGFRYPDAKSIDYSVLSASSGAVDIRVVQSEYSFYLISATNFWDLDYSRRKLTERMVPPLNTKVLSVVGGFTTNIFGRLRFRASNSVFVR